VTGRRVERPCGAHHPRRRNGRLSTTRRIFFLAGCRTAGPRGPRTV